MLSIPALPKTIIDSWTVADSGLPPRVVNSVTGEGISTIGQLRSAPESRLLEIRGLGRISLDHIRAFFQICDAISQGKQKFNTIQEVLAIFCDREEWEALEGRYGLLLEIVELKPYYATLQDIGAKTGKTRERIRQIQEGALLKLKGRLATVCLQPFFKEVETFIRDHDGLVTGEDVAALKPVAWLAGSNPSGMLILMSELPAAGFCYFHHTLSVMSVAALHALEAEILRLLETQSQPTTLQAIIDALTPPAGIESRQQFRKVVAGLLDQDERVAATLDERYFAYSTGMAAYLIHLLGQLQRPVHYRSLMQAFNDQVKPRSRKGAGFILDTLNAHPQFTRVDRGIYDLKA